MKGWEVAIRIKVYTKILPFQSSHTVFFLQLVFNDWWQRDMEAMVQPTLQAEW